MTCPCLAQGGVEHKKAWGWNTTTFLKLFCFLVFVSFTDRGVGLSPLQIQRRFTGGRARRRTVAGLGSRPS